MSSVFSQAEFYQMFVCLFDVCCTLLTLICALQRCKDCSYSDINKDTTLLNKGTTGAVIILGGNCTEMPLWSHHCLNDRSVLNELRLRSMCTSD